MDYDKLMRLLPWIFIFVALGVMMDIYMKLHHLSWIS